MNNKKHLWNPALKSAFIVWGFPIQGPRSKVLARELGIRSLHFIYFDGRRGALSAPIRYIHQSLKTLKILLRERPNIVFVQSPPSIAALFVCLYSLLTGAKYVIDAHSAAFQLWFWTWPEWLHRFIARKAIVTIVTNDHFQRKIKGWKARAFILRDIPTNFEMCRYYLPV